MVIRCKHGTNTIRRAGGNVVPTLTLTLTLIPYYLTQSLVRNNVFCRGVDFN